MPEIDEDSDVAVDQLNAWWDDPVQAVRDLFGVEPEPWQAEALREFVATRRMCFKASKGPGKSALLAWFILIFMLCNPDTRVACTSISGDNLRDNLWSELAKWIKKSKVLDAAFLWTASRITSRSSPETHWCSFRTWPRTGDQTRQADTLAGLHEDNAMAVLDEAGGIPEAVLATADGVLATGKNTKIIMAGNPTHTDGPIWNACTRDKERWRVIEVNGDPDDPNRCSRIDKEWAQEQIDTHGRDNPWVLVNVFGRFPPSSINAMIGPDQITDAMGRNLQEGAYKFAQKRIGIDAARFGGDSWVIFPRQGLVAFTPIQMRNPRTYEIAARVALAKQKWGSEVEFYDGSGGYAAGVVDAMIQAGHSPMEVQFAGIPDDDRYHNKRAEMWFRMIEWIKRGGVLPNIPQLHKELTTVQYTFNSKGKFMIEEKEQIKKRLGFSPDYADALALTFAWAEMPSNERRDRTQPGYGDGKLVSEYNELDGVSN